MATTSGSSQPPSLPPFLSATREEIHTKFVELEWLQRERIQEGQQNRDPPTRYTRMTGEAASVRNRYLNVEPFALHRVKLQVPEGANDYINASPIELDRRRFIATQGPKDLTINHFYRMIAAETTNPAVIVMLTQTHESGREKCFQYYPLTPTESPLPIPPDPEIPDGFEGEVALLSVHDDPASRSQVRHLKLTTRPTTTAPEGIERDIYHLLFAGWPDFLVPEGDDRAALVELVRLSAALTSPSTSIPPPVNADPPPPTTSTEDTSTPPPNPTNGVVPDLPSALASIDPANPRVIHCSAGVGRSGTFIALDILLQRLHQGELDGVVTGSSGGEKSGSSNSSGGEGNGEGNGGPEMAGEPICEVVDALRRQRMMMVQGEAQFHFLYEVLRGEWERRGAGGGE